MSDYRISDGALKVLDYSLWRLPADATRSVILSDMKGEFPEEWMLEIADREVGRDHPVRFCLNCESADNMGTRCYWCGSSNVVTSDDVRDLVRRAKGVESA